LPDEYELAFGFNPNKADDSKIDSDNDGKSIIMNILMAPIH
jgi:hypothetical protein